ncbi:SOS response-associated peptidase family protein [Dokdonella sp.]|uniref:SOS response-associated peptidase family protein n=1 Tax=Dokdonella sp. TaxID=2291710 RepID=UPI002F3E2124
MCYSAQIWQSYRRYVRAWGADISIEQFVELYFLRSQDPKVRIAKAMDASFAEPANDAERRIKALIDRFDAEQETRLTQELFAQRKRLADAERTLQSKTTKKALEDRRIATSKIDWALGKLAALRRVEPVDEDSRIFPGWYAPVMVWEDGRRVVKPMRYQCRPAGAPAFYDTKFPGTYNARRDNLEGNFWKNLFGRTHGIMVANAFFENVSRHAMEHRELAPGEKDENVVLEFRPRPTQDMLVACLWSKWEGEGGTLLSFAAITDEPPPEVAAAGHDRCIIPIKPGNVDAWLRADPRDLAGAYAILDDRARPYYEHRLAA